MADTRLTIPLMCALVVGACGPSETPAPPISETNSSIRAALKAGDPDRAATIIADTPLDRWNSETTTLKFETDDQLEALMLSDRIHGLISEVDENQISLLQQISTTPTKDPVEIVSRVERLEESVRFLEKVPEANLTTAQSAARRRLEAAILVHQRRIMPALRRSYAEGLDSRLWDNDIRVTALGAGSSTVRFVGYLFASSSNIRPVQEANRQMLDRLRFRRAEYRSHSSSDTIAFTLSGPTDSDIGYWDGPTFKAVS